MVVVRGFLETGFGDVHCVHFCVRGFLETGYGAVHCVHFCVCGFLETGYGAVHCVHFCVRLIFANRIYFIFQNVTFMRNELL